MTKCAFPGCDRVLAVNPRRKGNMCQRHAAAAIAKDPEKRARAAATMRAYYAEPGRREATGARVSKVLQKKMRTDPEYAARMRAIGSDLGSRQLAKHDPAGSPKRIAAGRKQSATVLGDIPLEYREEHRLRVKNHGIKSADSKRMAIEQVQRDQKRYEQTGKLQQAKGHTDGR